MKDEKVYFITECYSKAVFDRFLFCFFFFLNHIIKSIPHYNFGALKSLPDNNLFFYLAKLKAFADDKLNTSPNFEFVINRVQDNVGKGEDAIYLHILLLPQ